MKIRFVLLKLLPSCRSRLFFTLHLYLIFSNDVYNVLLYKNKFLLHIYSSKEQTLSRIIQQLKDLFALNPVVACPSVTTLTFWPWSWTFTV